MFKALCTLPLCLAMFVSTGVAQESADFQSALQVTFPSTVSVNFADGANGGVNAQGMQRWQWRAAQGGMFAQLPGMEMMNNRAVVRTGFAVSADHVLTHLDTDSDDIVITTIDNTQHDAKVVARDNVTGLCVAKVDGVELVSIPVGSGEQLPGLPVVTTWLDDGTPRCKRGIIASPLQSGSPKIGMTHHVDFGDRAPLVGSPIVDSSGVLVGVTVGGDDGETVCLPASQLNRLIDSALNGEPQDLERGLVGVAFSSDSGSVISNVNEGSPAAKSDLQTGDEVTQIGDHLVRSSRDVVAAVATARAGDDIDVTVRRGDQTMTQTLTLGQHPEQRVTLAPLEGDGENGKAIVQRQGWQLKDGKMVPMDLDADGNFDMVLPKELQGLFGNNPGALPNQFRMPRRFQGLRVERSDTEESIRELEAQRDRQADKIKELTEKIEELESKN